MTNKEVYQMCLDERVSKLNQLNEELKKIKIALQKSEIEEKMYSYLTKHSSFQNIFSEKHSASIKEVDELEEQQQKKVEEEIKVMNFEIEYLKRILEN